MNTKTVPLRVRSLPRISGFVISPATRVALGLVALMISMLLVVDVFVHGFLPDRTDQAQRERKQIVHSLAGQVSRNLQTSGFENLSELLVQARQNNRDIRSAAVVVINDQRSASAGDHSQYWRLAAGAPSTLENVRALLAVDNRPWGELQVAFAPAMPTHLLGWLSLPIVQGLLAMMTIGFLAFQMYLRRAMLYLDPSRAVPERVRAALDTLSECVLVLDTKQTVMLANCAFRELTADQADLIGRSLDSLTWLKEATQGQGVKPPWHLAQLLNQAQIGQYLRLNTPVGPRHMVMNCTPINEGEGKARGCLVTIADVTELEERTQRLREALAELEASKEEIHRKNEELVLLATRDPLTGCLNRRAFVDKSAAFVDVTSDSSRVSSCVMCDIDHFKRINDTYGHAGGDIVLQAVAKTLGRGLRVGDLLARFGGEEFCILLADTTLAQAREIVERLRAGIEATAGTALRQHDNVRVTMSFGIEQVGPHHAGLDAVIDLADQALYHSKKSGRNRVTAYVDIPEEALKP